MAELNPDTYQVFLEVLAKAPCATTYKCRDLQRGIARELPGAMFDELPWDGEVDDIISATWTLPREFAAIMGLDFNQAGQISMNLTHDGGIYVSNPYNLPRTHAVGLADVARQQTRPQSEPPRRAQPRHGGLARGDGHEGAGAARCGRLAERRRHRRTGRRRLQRLVKGFVAAAGRTFLFSTAATLAYMNAYSC